MQKHIYVEVVHEANISMVNRCIGFFVCNDFMEAIVLRIGSLVYDERSEHMDTKAFREKLYGAVTEAYGLTKEKEKAEDKDGQ